MLTKHYEDCQGYMGDIQTFSCSYEVGLGSLQVWFSLCFRANAGVPTIYRMVTEDSRWEVVCEKRGWYQCSYRRVSAYIEGPNLLTWNGIYHKPHGSIDRFCKTSPMS